MRRALPFALATLLLAGPLSAYTIYLKDGQTIISKGKYKVENGRAIIVLPNGTQTFINAAEIDVRRTEEANRSDLGNAMVLEGKRPSNQPPPGAPQQKRLSDVIASREVPREPGVRPEVRRDTPAAPGNATRTRAGFTDLSGVGRKPHSNLDLASELQQFLRAQGLQETEIYAGTQGDRILLEITTNSEGSVFRGLTTSANALLHIREAHPGKVAAFEILMTTPERERAGQFLLTPELASDLVAQRVEVTAFFIDHVQF
jgi:hypothetical protein